MGSNWLSLGQLTKVHQEKCKTKLCKKLFLVNMNHQLFM